MAKFKYRERSREEVDRRAAQQGGLYDNYFKPHIPAPFTPQKDNLIRFLPPTWEGAEHYGLDIWIHYNIGADNQAYLCLDKNPAGGGNCPLCAETARAQKAGDDDYASKIKAVKRVLVWVIDRDNEKDGPKPWASAWTIDRDISALTIDKRSGEVLLIDHPQKGYDVEFRKDGKGERTRYTAFAIARKSTPLSDDEKTEEEWLDYITENPLPSILNFYSAEHIQKVFDGGISGGEKDEERTQTRAERGRSRDTDDDDGGSRRSRSNDREIDDDDADTGEPVRTSRRQIDDKDEPLDKPSRDRDEPSPRERSSRRSDDDKPRERAFRDADEDEEPRSRSRRDDDEDEEPRERSSRRSDEDDDDEKPRERDEAPRRSRRDDDEDEKPRTSRSRRYDDDDDDDDDEPRPLKPRG